MLTQFRLTVLSIFGLTLVQCLFVVALGGTIELDIRPGKGVTHQKMLSDYYPPFKNTNFDTPIFFLQGEKPGITGLAIGGTHPNELAGQVAALVMVEKGEVRVGRLIVIPYANRSALSVKDTQYGVAPLHEILTKTGIRYLPYGDRRTDIKDQQQDDPRVYTNPGGYTLKNGKEARNLNRAYPGKVDGTPTEQLAYAIIKMIEAESIEFCVDFHEARTLDEHKTDKTDNGYPSRRLAYTLVSNPKATELAAISLLDMEEDTGVTMKLEESNTRYRGLSHLEIGNATNCLSFLTESPNPGQDKWREDADVINDMKYPLVHRVGIHLRVFINLANVISEEFGKPFTVKGIPEYEALLKGDIGMFLN